MYRLLFVAAGNRLLSVAAGKIQTLQYSRRTSLHLIFAQNLSDPLHDLSWYVVPKVTNVQTFIPISLIELKDPDSTIVSQTIVD